MNKYNLYELAKIGQYVLERERQREEMEKQAKARNILALLALLAAGGGAATIASNPDLQNSLSEFVASRVRGTSLDPRPSLSDTITETLGLPGSSNSQFSGWN